MATFTQAEFDNQARIERGYERFARTTVPFGLDPEFGYLKKAIAFRDACYGTQTPARFSILDGVGEIESKTVTSKASTLLGELVNGNFHTADSINPRELLDLLVAKSHERGANGHATFYLLSQDQQKILGAIDLRDGNLTTSYIRSPKIVADWEAKEFSGIVGHDETYSRSAYQDGKLLPELLDLETMFRDVGYQKMSEGDSPGASARWSVNFLADGGVFKDQILEDRSHSSERRILQDPKARQFCLMMTQPWLDPAYSVSSNIPDARVLQHMERSGLSVVSNCVEQAVANAINLQNGLGNHTVKPRLRVLPSAIELKKPMPRINLDGLDPLSEQSLPSRLFGTPIVIKEKASLEDLGISETGTLVQVMGHMFLAVKDDDSIGIYDTTMGFCGPSNLYLNFCNSERLSTNIGSVTQVRLIDRQRSDFHDRCREPFRNRDVYERTIQIFTARADDSRDIHRLYSAWNQAVGEDPKLIMEGLKIKGPGSGTEMVEPHSQQENMVGTSIFHQMLAEQDTGFVNYSMHCFGGLPDLYFTIFKDGDNVLFSNGEGSRALDMDPESEYWFRGRNMSNYQVVSFGGDEIEAMREVHAKAITPELVATTRPIPGASSIDR